jgi:hypothetical protein
LSRDWWLDAASFSTLVALGQIPNCAPDADALAASWLKWFPLTRDADYGELDRLAKAASGPVRLTGEAAAWASNSKFLTRLLEFDRYLQKTLALAVRSTRLGCRLAEPL